MLMVERGPFLDSEGGRAAYVLDGNGIATRTNITVGSSSLSAVEILSDILDQRIPGQVEQDAATALVDPAWRENMRLRWNAVAGLDLSQPRAGAAPPDSDAH